MVRPGWPLLALLPLVLVACGGTESLPAATLPSRVKGGVLAGAMAFVVLAAFLIVGRPSSGDNENTDQDRAVAAATTKPALTRTAPAQTQTPSATPAPTGTPQVEQPTRPVVV